MEVQEGGCLCGTCRYQVTAPPLRVTTCHCRFCQRTTGSSYMVEPIFTHDSFSMTRGSPKIWEHLSKGSGKHLWLHFCPDCGGRLYLGFERFDQIVGVFAGSFDDPGWFEITPDNSKHIFLGNAVRGTIIPPEIETYAEHVTDRRGNLQPPVVFDKAQQL